MYKMEINYSCCVLVQTKMGCEHHTWAVAGSWTRWVSRMAEVSRQTAGGGRCSSDTIWEEPGVLEAAVEGCWEEVNFVIFMGVGKRKIYESA